MGDDTVMQSVDQNELGPVNSKERHSGESDDERTALELVEEHKESENKNTRKRKRQPQRLS